MPFIAIINLNGKAKTLKGEKLAFKTIIKKINNIANYRLN